MSRLITRRTLVTAGLTAAAGASGLGAAIHYGLIPPDYGGITGIGETLTYSAQRLLTSGYSLAREFKRSDISKIPIVNGPAPVDETFRALAADGFKDWRLKIEGLIANPTSFSLEELRRLPAESHIVLHACEQGWSYIAEWTGVRLSAVLDLVKTRPGARYAVFMPFPNPRQTTGEERVQWDSIDMARCPSPANAAGLWHEWRGVAAGLRRPRSPSPRAPARLQKYQISFSNHRHRRHGPLPQRPRHLVRRYLTLLLAMMFKWLPRVASRGGGSAHCP
jgi:hypothetical protein